MTPLTTADAETLIAAARRDTDEAEVPVSITVLDGGGHLSAFRRDERAVLICGGTGTAKPHTARQLNEPTAEVADLVKPNGLQHSLPTALNKPLLFIGGGVPVHRGGQLIGALGLGGGAAEQDRGFAQPALQAPSDQYPLVPVSADQH
ncbi:heme-binding protein [Streptomyces olivaceus]|uniref:GlcG/HbpS family heme-binding protein n=1 Tax=Streptomyces olivaceus TaxID=47716 RepID=UPI001CCF0102|nr:heme-binding protein [Streptomyces olivaceus]MBZ6081677.1 heme-binding protein [Streptomyces olivaceus]